MKKIKENMILFLNSLMISAFTFGGGYVIISMMRKKYVEKKKVISDEEMMNIMTLAQASPGPIAVNTSLLLGFKLSGILGAISCLLGTIIPPLVILTIISNIYDMISDNAILGAVMHGMEAGIAAIIIDVVLSLVIVVKKEKNWWAVITLPITFVLAFMGINVIFIIFPAFAIAIGITLFEKFRMDKKIAKENKSKILLETTIEDEVLVSSEDVVSGHDEIIEAEDISDERIENNNTAEDKEGEK